MISSPRTDPAMDAEGSRTRLRWLLIATASLAVLSAAVWWPGCKQYPEVSSPEGLRLIRMLYTACNTRNAGRLAQVELAVEKAKQDGMLTPAEERAFAKVIDLARNGDWEAAEKAGFKFASDQRR